MKGEVFVYTLSVPVMVGTVTAENMHIYLKNIREAGAKRVFIGLDTYLHDPDSRVNKNPESIKTLIDFFKQNGLEVGVWSSGIGHGMVLLHENGEPKVFAFNVLEGADGSKNPGVFCPSDENYTRVFCDGIKKIAQMNPDIIMIDDDLRFNSRKSVRMACFCPKHLEMFYEKTGERVPRENIEKLVLSGGKNKYRTGYFEMMGESLINFAKAVRKSVDSVNPSIRLGSCSCCDSWDFSGVTPMELAKAFAGSTKPFLRTIGAPYWSDNIIDVIEDTRLQMSWCTDDTEIFAEGDVYPRPRYNVPSKRLENFHFALLCDGSGDGILKYMFDYNFKPEYEMGYLQRHIKNESIRTELEKIFEGKKNAGIYAVNNLAKNENYSLPEEFSKNNLNTLISGYRNSSSQLLAKNSISTSCEKNDFPIFLCGENAKYISEKDLENGAILDLCAAKILQARGIDTGLSGSEDATFGGEYFPDADETVHNIGGRGFQKIVINEKAVPKSFFVPENVPASYIYENTDGIRFFVLAINYYGFVEAKTFSELSYESNYAHNYHRQKQLIDAVEWVGKKKLPAVCVKNPNLYLLTKRGKDSLSVALMNNFADDVISPQIRLDKEYKNIRFVNCEGKLEGDRVYLTDIPSFGFAAFEVKEGTV